MQFYYLIRGTPCKNCWTIFPIWALQNHYTMRIHCSLSLRPNEPLDLVIYKIIESCFPVIMATTPPTATMVPNYRYIHPIEYIVQCVWNTLRMVLRVKSSITVQHFVSEFADDRRNPCSGRRYNNSSPRGSMDHHSHPATPPPSRICNDASNLNMHKGSDRQRTIPSTLDPGRNGFNWAS